MSTQRYISTSFWDDPWVHALTPNEKLLYLHLMTCPLTNIAGVYEITNDRIAFDTGLKHDAISKCLQKFQKDEKAYRYDMYIIVKTWPKHQKWEQRSKIKSGIEKILVKLDSKLLSYLKDIGYTYPIDTLPISYTYVSSYSELDLDSELDTDIDIESDNKEGNKSPSKIETDFNEIYSFYPWKKGKTPALKKYKEYRRLKTVPDNQTLIEHIEASKKTKSWQDGFVPHFSTWMNQRRWG
jgi:hypothetical protein